MSCKDKDSKPDEVASCLVKELQDCCILGEQTATLNCGHKLNVLNVACGSERHRVGHDNKMPVVKGTVSGGSCNRPKRLWLQYNGGTTGFGETGAVYWKVSTLCVDRWHHS
jgi:hypothetical protein